VKQDYEQAVFWFRKAAEQENEWGLYHLGECYYYGDGVKKDLKQAKYWLRKAVEQGNWYAAEFDVFSNEERKEFFGPGPTQVNQKPQSPNY
jgi:hypothetical protein